MEYIAEDRPEKLRLRIGTDTQCGKFFSGVLDLQYRRNLIGNLPGTGNVILFGDIDHQNIFATFGEETGLGFLPERALVDQRFQHRRHGIVLVPGIVRQIVVHGFECVCKRVETDHIGGPVRCTFRATDCGAGQGIDFIERQLELHRVIHRRGDGKNANAVGHKVGRVIGTDDALTDGRREKGFELIEDRRFRIRRRNQFDQFHVARWIEEMHAAKAMAQIFRKHF